MKKVLSLVLAVVLVLGMSSFAFAIKYEDSALAGIGLGLSDNSGVTGNHLVENDSRPEMKYYFYLANAAGEPIYREDVRDSKIDVQIRATQGSAVVKSAKIEYYDIIIPADPAVAGSVKVTRQGARVVVEMVKEWVSTKDQEFDILLYLTANKKRITSGNDNYQARISGTFENYFTEIDEEDYVYAYDTPVIKANEYNRNVKVDLGQNIAINAKMFDGKKYYGRVSQDIKEADEAIIAKYPDIETIYYLSTIGLSSTGDVVEWYDLGDNFYVYVQNEDGNLVFIGRSNDKLPYFTKYFLSTKELPVDDAIVEPGTDLEPEGEGPSTGGDDAPANINDNPSTGR